MIRDTAMTTMSTTAPHPRLLAITDQIRQRSTLLRKAYLARIDAELERLNDLLAKGNQELAEANQELDAFCAAVSHDLRTPLAVITGAAGGIGPHLPSAVLEPLPALLGAGVLGPQRRCLPGHL